MKNLLSWIGPETIRTMHEECSDMVLNTQNLLRAFSFFYRYREKIFICPRHEEKFYCVYVCVCVCQKVRQRVAHGKTTWHITDVLPLTYTGN